MKKYIKNNYKLLLLIFIIGSFTGFIYEELFYYFIENRLVYTGFFYGPYVPVYGTGAVLIYLFLYKFKKHPFLVFFISLVLTGVLEYFTGLFMFKIWNSTWWDYTNLFLNIDGYVCLRSVLTFAIGGLFLIYIVVPFINNKILIKEKFTNIFIKIFIIIFIIDIILSLIIRHPIF